MDARQWNVLLVEPNKYEALIIADLLRFAGVQSLQIFGDGAEALAAAALGQFNIVLMEFDCEGVDGLTFTRRLRRMRTSPARKAAIMQMTKRLSRSIVESCRIAGANAAIGKPISGATLINTIKKVVLNPRPFIEGANYVGPCRRAGIVTAGSAPQRRVNDVPASEDDVRALISRALVAVNELLAGRQVRVQPCEEMLYEIRNRAAVIEDGPLMRVSSALVSQLENRQDANGRAALIACSEGLGALAQPGLPSEKRAGVAENVCRAVEAAAARAA